jgi:hypothetical protein
MWGKMRKYGEDATITKECVEKMGNQNVGMEEILYFQDYPPFQKSHVTPPISLPKVWYATVSRNGPLLVIWYTMKDQSNPIGSRSTPRQRIVVRSLILVSASEMYAGSAMI